MAEKNLFFKIKKMKILGICGSHRKNFETEKSLDLALQICAEKNFSTEKISLAEKKINFCCVCGRCAEKGECAIADDGKKILEKMRAADGIIFASPVYFGAVSARLKNIFDRSAALRKKFFLRDKFCTGIAVGRCRNGGQEFVLSQIQNFANIHGMIFLGDDEHFGGTVVESIENDEFGKKTVENSAEKLCRILQKIKN